MTLKVLTTLLFSNVSIYFKLSQNVMQIKVSQGLGSLNAGLLILSRTLVVIIGGTQNTSCTI